MQHYCIQYPQTHIDIHPSIHPSIHLQLVLFIMCLFFAFCFIRTQSLSFLRLQQVPTPLATWQDWLLSFRLSDGCLVPWQGLASVVGFDRHDIYIYTHRFRYIYIYTYYIYTYGPCYVRVTIHTYLFEDWFGIGNPYRTRVNHDTHCRQTEI